MQFSMASILPGQVRLISHSRSHAIIPFTQRIQIDFIIIITAKKDLISWIFYENMKKIIVYGHLFRKLRNILDRLLLLAITLNYEINSNLLC
jgi:hypothetical protein